MTHLQKAQWKGMIKDTILKELRSKTLLFIFIATTLMILLAHAILKMFVGNSDTPINAMISGVNTLNFMFNLINLWSILICGIFGISSIRSDLKDKIIYQYLTFPISRTQYMFSRIIGTWILVYGYYLYSYLLSALLFSLATHSLVLHWAHLISMMLMGVYVLLVIFISFLYSLMADKIGALLLLIVTVITISLSTSSMRVMALNEYFKNISFFKFIGLIVYLFIPRINYVTELASALISNEGVKLNIIPEALHLMLTTYIFIFIAVRFIKKKNF